MPNKNPMTAFMLSFIPGLGHLYLGRYLRAFIYGSGFFVSLFAVFLLIVTNVRSEEPIVFFLFIAFLFGFINLLDMIIHLIKRSNRPVTYVEGGTAGADGSPMNSESRGSSDRFFILMLSFIPGLGHFHLGLMQRGLVFLIGFFGLGAMIIFLAAVSNAEGFLAFLLALPVIWIFCLSDLVQQLNRRDRGETLVDRSVLDDFQESRAEGRKSKMLATLLSVFPGAGHMYLGLQKRGLQLMAAFLFSIYILDALHLSLFLFIIPILWFYSFFDALQLVSRHDREPLEDVPFVQWLLNRQKWVGLALLALGLYYLFDQTIISILDRLFPRVEITLWLSRYLQPVIVSLLLIGGGIKLMLGSKTKQGGTKQ
jgi:hypothetical protein